MNRRPNWSLVFIDDCLEITEVDGYYIHLEPTSESQPFPSHNGYHIIPPDVVAAYAAKRIKV
ncbi:MAG TPA: hypothetical protein VKC60_12760 [Opitutaceae bacterium]|nr:hypothetical protein [Opitutaceae bacterium]